MASLQDDFTHKGVLQLICNTPFLLSGNAVLCMRDVFGLGGVIYLSRWNYVQIRLMISNCALETSDLHTKEELKRFFRALAVKGVAVCLFGYNRSDLLELCDSIYLIERDGISRKYSNQEAKGLHGPGVNTLTMDT